MKNITIHPERTIKKEKNNTAARENAKLLLAREVADVLIALEAAHNELRQVREQLAAEQVTSQSLRNAANGYKLELDAERKKANDARNELCLKCGRYHEAHNGACDGCRWGDDT